MGSIASPPITAWIPVAQAAVTVQGKLTVMAPVHDLQIDPSKRAKWIYYSALDARATFELYQALKVFSSLPHCP